MSQAFNPYREWLGIAAHSDSPSYYELLGLRPLENDATKVEPAYQRQAAKLAGHLSGGQADVAQRLMGELAEARITLMTPTAKRAYDSALAGAVQAAGQKASAQAAMPSSTQATAAPTTAQPTPVQAQPLAAQPLAAQPLAAQDAAAPIYGQPQSMQYGYTPQAPSHAAPMQAYPAAQVYSGWPGQPGVPVNPAAATAPGYYAAPAATYPSATEPVVPNTPVPEIRRRRSVRRRSSAVPALASVVVAAAIIGGLWIYFQKSESVAVGKPDQNGAAPPERVETKPAATSPEPTAGREGNRTGTKEPKPTNDGGKSSARSAPPEVANSEPLFTPPVIVPAPAMNTDKPKADSDMPQEDMPDNDKPDGDTPNTEKPEMDKPDDDKPEMVSEKPSPDKPSPDEPEKPEPETPKDEPVEEPKASPEEAATVAGLLKSARAALANREISKAQDLLAEATIEATAPDTTAEVSQVETLTSYVEMFWDAVRKTLPKIELEEIELKGTMLAVVEADENHLIVRAEGKNHEYKWQKIPHDLAYYLANRWLAPDDPVRNLVLGAFEIVDAKGDRKHAESLLDAAAAAKLKTDPLKEELKSSR
ncbi:MAG TPA: hypothetical protein VFI31_17000 [Pirellulales bacterium]|nr:hypothetical protein [Pirellulales bacterium]